MDALEQFRIETRKWLEAHCPATMRTPITREQQVWAGRQKIFPSDDARLWFDRMVAKGWTCPEWPTQYGGGGLNPQQSKILQQEMKAIGARKPLYDLGIWMLGPALLEYGNEQQKCEHIPKICRGEIRWAQGYSEPGAGSDLASLNTKAEDRGDHFLVNGTKLWTTSGDKADWIFCLVRTDPDAIKQQGISFLLIDMASAGITVSPYLLINGEAEFSETSFVNVKVPKANLVGEINRGWSVAKSLLKHERKLMSEIGNDTPGPSYGPVQAALKYVGLGQDGKLQDADLRNQLVEHDMRFRALSLTHFRTFEERINGTDSTVPLIMKYIGTEATKNREELLVALLGARGIGWDETIFTEDELLTTKGMLFSKALSIAGGTSEVQLNIIAKRVLGLPEA